MEREPIKYDR